MWWVAGWNAGSGETLTEVSGGVAGGGRYDRRSVCSVGEGVAEEESGEDGGDGEVAVVKWRRRRVRERREGGKDGTWPASFERSGEVKRGPTVEGLGEAACARAAGLNRGGGGWPSWSVKGPAGTAGGSGALDCD